MEPLVSIAGSALIERVMESFGKRVIGRWADYRVRKFIDQFVQECAATNGSDDLGTRLDGIVTDDTKSAALFDAFRHVAFSASRDIGPRVIAIHMAEAIAGLVEDPEVGDAVMAAAATLLDSEFGDFLSYAAEHQIDPLSFADSLHDTAVIKLEVVSFDSNWRGSRQDTGPLNLRRDIGAWAQKLNNVGLLFQDVSEEEVDYREDSDAHIDEPGTLRRVHRNIELGSGVAHLVRVTQKAIAATKSA
jgi:hypothetical protein